MEEQLTLFQEADIPRPPKPKARSGGSANSIVFHDYESFIAKFADNPKTTDDCFTPQDVYEAVVRYVGTIVDLTDKVILRPFFPGGDYEHSDYPDNGVVIDNPPFSIFTKCCAFYARHHIPFFLFGPGLTITSCCKYCTAVIVADQITFENGAKVKCNFASNLYGDKIITTAPLLNEYITACESQNQKANLAKYRYPDEVLDVSAVQTICRGGGYRLVLEPQRVRHYPRPRPASETWWPIWRPLSDVGCEGRGERSGPPAGARSGPPGGANRT